MVGDQRPAVVGGQCPAVVGGQCPADVGDRGEQSVAAVAHVGGRDPQQAAVHQLQERCDGVQPVERVGVYDGLHQFEASATGEV